MKRILVIMLLSIPLYANDVSVEVLKGVIVIKDSSSYGLEIATFGEDDTYITIRLDPREFINCRIDKAYLTVRDRQNNEVIGTELSSNSGRYFIRISKTYLINSTVGLSCKSQDSDFSRDSYWVNLGELSIP